MLIMPPPLWMPSQTGLVLSYSSYLSPGVNNHNGTNYYIPITRQAMGANDLQIIAAFCPNKGTSNHVDDTGYSAPSGFTLKSDARMAAGYVSCALYYMTGSTTEAVVEIPLDGNGDANVFAPIYQAVLKGADTASPFDVDPIYEEDTSSNPDPASFSITNDGAMVFSLLCADDDSTLTAEPYPSGYTDITHIRSFAGYDRTYIFSYKPDVAAGPRILV